MGFFSWKCGECGVGVLNTYRATGEYAHLADVVALKKNGAVIKGKYEGYGETGDGEEIHDDDFNAKVFHAGCYKGQTWGDTKFSEADRWQGYFCTDAEIAAAIRRKATCKKTGPSLATSTTPNSSASSASGRGPQASTAGSSSNTPATTEILQS